MKANEITITSLRGTRKIRVKMETEKRGIVELDLTMNEAHDLIRMISASCTDIHEEEQKYLCTVITENEMYKK